MSYHFGARRTIILSMNPLRLFMLLLVCFLAGGLAACDAAGTDDETLPAFNGPALLFFYTDG